MAILICTQNIDLLT